MTTDTKPANSSFCQAPSQRYLQILEELNYDPRSVAGFDAIYNLINGKGGGNAIDVREASGVETFTAKAIDDVLIKLTGK
jgi:hypothetical protein